MRLGVEMDSLTEHVIFLEMPGKQEASLRLAIGLANSHGLLDLVLGKVESDQIGSRFSLFIVPDGLLQITDGFVVLAKPRVKFLVFLLVYVLSQFFYLSSLQKHSWHLLYVRI